MILKAVIDDQTHEIHVPDSLLNQAQAFFDQMDVDMRRGWQMSRDWIATPDQQQRCQIVADKLLTALESSNQKLAMMMAGYILSRLPGVASVMLDVQGEMQNHAFQFSEQPLTPVNQVRQGLSKLDALGQAGRDVTDVFKVGRGYRFSTFDHAAGIWRDSPLAMTEPEAALQRQAAFKARYETLLQGFSGTSETNRQGA